MTALEGGTFASGHAVYPLTTVTTNPILLDADPSLHYALAFFQQMIATYIAPRWDIEAAAAALYLPATTTPLPSVVTPIGFDPAPYLQEMQLQLPCLAVYRVGGKSSDLTIQKDHRTGAWKVDWILPPMSPAQRRRLQPFLKAVYDVLDNRLSWPHDPNYAGGVSPWFQAGLEEIYFADYQIGNLATADKILFPTLSCNLFVKERVESVAGAFPALTGTANTVGIGTTPGAPADPFATFNTP